jgi:O-methyltransferase domain/Dimerisation domain
MSANPVAPDRIMQLGMGFMASKTVLSAVELGVFTALADGPLTREQVQARLGLHERSGRDFLDTLVALRLLQRDSSERYANTTEADLYLDRGKPAYVGGLLEMLNARLYGFWGSLSEALKTGKPQNESKSGGETFTALYADPARLESFLAAMTGVSLPNALAVAQLFPWRDYKSVIDIGAAQGCLPVQLALAHSHLTGGGFDLPPIKQSFESYVRANGLSDRLRFYAGDFMSDPLPSADVLVMGHILHDWDLPMKRMLLAKAYAALPVGGALIVYDMIIDDARRENVAGLLMSLNMLIETSGGFDYTGTDCIGWMRDAGFTKASVKPLVGPHSMVIGLK